MKPPFTKLACSDQLPLTCSRSGTCCHGKLVSLNPWELARLAHAKGLSPRDFRARFCDDGGLRLHFDGALGWKGQSACSQYLPHLGCSVHEGRPLVCRLFPLGRQRQGQENYYMHQGSEFPCLEGCPEVLKLPKMSVADYIVGQSAKLFETAHDDYLELMQLLADASFALLLETGLAESGDRLTLRLWRKLGGAEPMALAERMGSEWLDLLMIPELSSCLPHPSEFARQHAELLQAKAQEKFGNLEHLDAYREASGLMMSLALHLGRGLGANPVTLVEHWISTAKQNGALE